MTDSKWLWVGLAGVAAWLLFSRAAATTPAVIGPAIFLPSPTPATPPPQIVADVATLSGDGVLRLSGQAGEVGAFALSVTNVGGPGQVHVSVESPLVLSMELCETDVRANCLAPAGPVVSLPMIAGQAATFSVFVAANPGTAIPLDAANNVVRVHFTDAAGLSYGVATVPVTA